MKVDNVLIGLQKYKSDCLESMMKIINKKKIKLNILEANMRVQISKNCWLDILWPIKNELIAENAINNNSLVFKLYYNQISVLFTGDIEEIAEKQIVEKYKNTNILQANLLKVAHHGSKTSSIQNFIESVKPQIALIGVGKDNNFGHPNKFVIERLKNLRYKNL